MSTAIKLTSNKKILLIEDNLGDARLVELFLENSDLANYEIIHKATLAEGLKLVSQFEFEVILLDLSLPDSSGQKTYEQLFELNPNLNIIVLTGNSDKSIGIDAVKSGAQDFLVKGEFDQDMLAKTLKFSIERNSILRKLEETQRLSHIGHWEYKSNEKFFTASNEFYRILGLKPKRNSISKSDVFDPNHPVSFLKTTFETILVDHPNEEDLWFIRTDGKPRYLSLHCEKVQETENVYLIQGIIQDITIRKEAEQENRQSKERYQDIFKKSKDGIIICDYNGNVLDCNPAMNQLVNCSQFGEESIDIFSIFKSPSVKDLVKNRLEQKLGINETQVEIQNFKGDVRTCILIATHLSSDEGNTYNIILRDITEQQQAEKLQKARALADQSAKLREQFLASISHEMRTPMNAILGMSNLLDKTTIDDEQSGYVQSIKQSSEVLLGIVNDILEIATIEKGKIKFENERFNLFDFLENLRQVMIYKINEKELAFNIHIDSSIPKYVIGDKLRLSQILYNLVGNAIKFTDKGEVNIYVSQLVHNENTTQIKFSVEDTGIGMPADKIGAIFDSFTRIRTKDRIFEGTGLGLSIAKSLVEYQGGKMWVESEFGKGSSFHFDMIFDIASQADDHDDGIVKQAIIDSDFSFNLLLVEDHKMNQIVAKKTLEKQWKNINISIANHGKEAIVLLEEKKFDIILMDLQMPIMDGYETTEFVRTKLPKTVSEIPILAMTAHAHISKDEKFKEHGFNNFVLKPFEPEQLFNIISKYVIHK